MGKKEEFRGIVAQADGIPGLQITAETVALICKGVENGLTYETAAAAIGLQPHSIEKLRADAVALHNGDKRTLLWPESYLALLEDLIKRLFVAEAKGEEFLVSVILEQAKTDWKAAKWLLERRHPDRYMPEKLGPRQGIITPVGEKALDPRELSDDELLKIIEGEIVRGDTDS